MYVRLCRGAWAVGHASLLVIYTPGVGAPGVGPGHTDMPIDSTAKICSYRWDVSTFGRLGHFHAGRGWRAEGPYTGLDSRTPFASG
jgi:hypothetical protein